MIKEFIKAGSFLSEKRIRIAPSNFHPKITMEVEERIGSKHVSKAIPLTPSGNPTDWK
jgi:hypothetical protein